MVIALLKFRWILIFVLAGITVLGFAVRVVDTGVLCMNTQECKPLLDSTIGEFLGSQALMKQDINYIRTHPEEDVSLIQIHKDRLVRSAVLSIVVIWLVWWRWMGSHLCLL